MNFFGSLGFNIVADAGFKKQQGLLTTRRKKDETPDECDLRTELASLRISVEHGNNSLKSRFRRLYLPLTANRQKREIILLCCLKLHSFLIKLEPNNQIAKKYGFSVDTDGGDEDDDDNNNNNNSFNST